VPIHEPTLAVALTGPLALLRALSAAAAEGEDVCVRSPPAYTVETSVARGAGAPVTRTPEDGVADPGALPSEMEPDDPDDPDGLGASVEHPARATPAAATTHRERAAVDLRVRRAVRLPDGLVRCCTGSVGRCWEVTAPP
jgi:hypothetical protein